MYVSVEDMHYYYCRLRILYNGSRYETELIAGRRMVNINKAVFIDSIGVIIITHGTWLLKN